jgi:V/A-type H+-transporting ATPase subunit D
VVPRLEGELLAIRRQLDEQELQESLRLRWAADRNAKVTGTPTGTRSRRRTGTA